MTKKKQDPVPGELPRREEFETYDEYIKALNILAFDNIDAWTQLLYEAKKRKENNMGIDREILDAARKAREENLKKGLSYADWREIDNPGWYLSKEPHEANFERYLEYLKEYGFDYNELNKSEEQKVR